MLTIVAQVMEASTDKSDQKRVVEYGAHRAAEQFLAEANNGFSYQDDWWQVGFGSDGTVVGFVFPVIYPGCTQEGLEEASIYYIGVLPKYRGQNFGVDLLLKGTRVLQDVGVWRVFCDTATQNIPMISTFKQAGYCQYGEPWQRPV
ncbi:MAG: GNAT family N-acetyltransferase [Cyanobacteria bacterium J06626_18]